MPSQGQQGTFADGLKKVLGEVAQLAAFPDADLQLVSGIQSAIHQFYTKNAQHMGGGGPPGGGHMQPGGMGGGQMGGMPPGGGGPPGMGGPPPGGPGGLAGGPPPGGLPGGGMGPGGPPPGGAPSPGGGLMSQPNPDELRRMLGAGAGGP